MEASGSNPDAPIPPAEARRAAARQERVETIDGLRAQIKALEEREPELRQEIVEFEKMQRTTIAELEKTRRETVAGLEQTQRTALAALEQPQRAEIAELDKTLRTGPENAEELAEEIERRRTELDEQLARTRAEHAEELARVRTELDEELERTRTRLAEELAGMRAELASIGPAVVESRCTLGMKMSDFALEENEGHEQAIEDLQPLLAELRNDQRRAQREAERSAAEAKETLKTLQAEQRDDADAALPAVEQQFQPLIDAEIVGASIESANVRIARHRLALVDPIDKDSRLARELELDAALEELDAVRVRVLVLQEQKQAAVHHYSHPTAEKSKRLGEKLTKRFGRH